MTFPFQRILITISLVIATLSSAHAQSKYLEHVEKAVISIEQGDYDRAAESITKAFTLEANESLAHLCLATLYLHTGQVEQSVMEYKVALGLRTDDPLAYYGLGLALLGRPDSAGAISQLEKIDTTHETDARVVMAYLMGLRGEYGAASMQVEEVKDPTAVELRATALFKAGKYAEAKEGFLSLVEMFQTKGFQERPGVVMTFNPGSPIKFTGKSPKNLIVPPAIEAAKTVMVSDTTKLRADLTNAPNTSYVLFYIDDQMVALVNHSPFEFSWDTTRYSNGLHTVKIQGQTANNEIINEKSVRVQVDNQGREPYIFGGERVDAIRSKLWERIKLMPSIAAAHYMLAKCALDEGDNDSYIAYLEKAMAADPDYFDVRILMKKAYEPLKIYRELREGSSNGNKIIALTFDDGHKQKTEQILDRLNEAGVKATFFLTGKTCEENSGIVERVHREGHDIQNHTYSLRDLRNVPMVEIEKELFATIALIRDTTGKKSVYFRPPEGQLGANGVNVARNFGLQPVYWTADCSRYEGTTPDTMVKYILSSATPGGIIRMHNGEDLSMAELTAVLKALKEKEYRFVTISEMFSGR